MKKLLLVLASLAMIIGLCACGGGGGLFAKPTPTPIPEIDPATLITTDDVALNAGIHLLLRNQVQAVTVMLRQCFTEVSL